ncbi:Nitrilotriacetate monooxygenase component A [plant metagenome]|uniref:Nitrilotriacetate monooxygenase component A n=1 Tax=plant metagenome TaxID=1297885 RepID=A0A484REU9_9ZZZZ
MAYPRQLHLGLMFWATGTHSAGWRHPDAVADGAFDIGFIQSVVRQAEAARFDFLFLGDRLLADPALAKTNPGQMARLEPFNVAAAVAAVTERIGLVVTANPTYNDPVHVARMTAELDHLSGGRASWNIVTGADAGAARNFGRAAHWDNDQRYAWAGEFVQVVRKLWDSWEDEAAIDAGDGTWRVDPGRIHPIDHDGPLLRVRGASNIPRPPQGQVVLLHAGTSDKSRELGAREADVIFTGEATLASAKAYYRDVKQRAAAHGRRADEILILPGLIVIVAPSTDEAVAKYDALNALITLDAEDPPDTRVDAEQSPQGFQYVGMGRGSKRNLTLVSASIGVDVRGRDHDAVVPPEVREAAHAGGRAIFDFIAAVTRRTVDAADERRRVRYRDLIHASIAQTATVVGNPAEVADFMQRWLEEEAADGFNFFPSYLPGTLSDFATLVVPELQRRGLFRREYSGRTFREHLGLARPARVARQMPVPVEKGKAA